MITNNNAEVFDIDVVSDLFQQSLNGDDDIDLSSYVAAYNELNKLDDFINFIRHHSYQLSQLDDNFRLFALLGTVFTFVRSDVEEKESILSSLYSSDREHYATVHSMISWECRDGTPKANGSRTLLRLHRALQFVNDFLISLRDASEDAQLSWLCRRSYERTLSQYHGWFIRQGVSLASYTLPSRCIFIRKIAGTGQQTPPEERINDAIDRMVDASTMVYDRVQKIFSACDLLDLP
ncbi:unnamed protein product [Anisakis simplex]|uniref:Glycolipid transfer protein (Gltp), putative (inferred by orthology to a S. mansoni protein) n=1 Tax=Anisakis simplex TaxID=6269 RepID=A0A0M3JTW1_ANISI|nr:unnamed protein product [Anisakis simplex]